MLHILNQSPYQQYSLQSCLRSLVKDDELLLIEEAVYAASSHFLTSLAVPEPLKIYALEPDLKARGILSSCSSRVIAIDYNNFVDLTCTHKQIMSWVS